MPILQEKSDNYALFSDRVKKLRAVMNGRISEVAKAIGVSRTMIYDIRNKKVTVSDKMWRKLREAEIAVGLQPQTTSPMPLAAATQLTPAQRAEFEKKSFPEFTAEDWRTLATHYPKEAKELAASVEQIDQASKVIADAREQVGVQLRSMFAQLASLLPPPPKK
jgi:transcriptional regulator with XRE-family HTH domain